MRKVKDITVALPGRDQGKVFVITEMPALQGERWALKVLFAIGRSGVDLGDDIMKGGMAAIAVVGLKGLFSMKWEDAEPLLEEMFQCAKIKPDPLGHPEVTRAIYTDDDVEEIATRLMLRSAILELHTDFSVAAALSPSGTAATTASDGQSTQTSREPSLQS